MAPSYDPDDIVARTGAQETGAIRRRRCRGPLRCSRRHAVGPMLSPMQLKLMDASTDN
jgi:hypothetical protein